MPRTDTPENCVINRRRKTNDSEHNLKKKGEDKPPKMPWEMPDVSERVQKSVLIKMPEPLKIKLDYVIAQTPGVKSQQRFLLDLIRNAVEEKLEDLGAK